MIETGTQRITSTFLSPVNFEKTQSIGARLVPFSSSGSTSNQVEHRYVPQSSIESEKTFQLLLIFFRFVSLCLQLILIYKSEKWIGPYRSSTDSFLHWQQIDFTLVAILLIFCVLLQEKYSFIRNCFHLIVLIYSSWSYSWKYLFVFAYPLIFSEILRFSGQQSTLITSNQFPGHWCSINAADLRHETDCLRLEFNQRIRWILFSSFLTCYYICFIPLTFCDTHLISLDIFLLSQYVLILFLSFVLISTSHYLPLELLTVFHRNGKHLGSWQLLSNNSTSNFLHWDEKNQFAYEPNSIVKHKGEIFRSSSISSTVAEPDNVGHARFACLFSRPFVFPLILCSLQLILFLLQILHLLFDQRWFVHLSQMILFLFNSFSLHRTVRDVYLLYLVYSRE